MENTTQTNGKIINSIMYTDSGRTTIDHEGRKVKPRRDCSIRAVATATNRNYLEVLEEINQFVQQHPHKKEKCENVALKGITKYHLFKYMESKGFKWVACMGIGTGCKVHLKTEELPKGIIICRVSCHVVAVKDGVIYDNHDSTRNGKRCVYGYWIIQEEKLNLLPNTDGFKHSCN